ncbi:MAG: YihY/virulence factor BrkB family protein [Candidatus Nanopelagicales bacterium]
MTDKPPATAPVPVPVGVPGTIPGDRLDPLPKSLAPTLTTIEDRSQLAGTGFRAVTRFIDGRAPLLAAGTTYYLFLSLFALIAAVFGIAFLVGADAVSTAINDALQQAFPNLTGDQGINPATLQSVGQAATIFGLLVLLYSSSGAMVAASASLHHIYGAPKDGRNFVVARLRLLGWLLLLAPLALISFAPGAVLAGSAQPLRDSVGSTGPVGGVAVWVATTVVSWLIDFLVLYLLLSHLGGIRPPRRAVVTAAAFGAVGIEILKHLMGLIVAWSIAKPQYGAFAVPITTLLVLYLLTMVAFGAAALAGAIAEKAAPVPPADSDE